MRERSVSTTISERLQRNSSVAPRRISSHFTSLLEDVTPTLPLIFLSLIVCWVPLRTKRKPVLLVLSVLITNHSKRVVVGRPSWKMVPFQLVAPERAEPPKSRGFWGMVGFECEASSRSLHWHIYHQMLRGPSIDGHIAIFLSFRIERSGWWWYLLKWTISRLVAA